MLIGVWNSQERTATWNVTHMACGRPGLVSVAFQLVRPDGTTSPIPSHVVKLSRSTPMSGMTPKAMKKTSAGTASHPSDRPCTLLADRDGAGLADPTLATVTSS